MIVKVRSVKAESEFHLKVYFETGEIKVYDVKPWFDKYPVYKELEENPSLFFKVSVGPGGFGVIWTDRLDISCDDLYYDGIKVESPFDDLLSFREATKLWRLKKNTLRENIRSGKLIVGIDAKKLGREWLITKEAMIREFGTP